MKKTAFVLPGGGLKGAYQAGAIVQLAGREIFPDVVAGVSVGSLNAAMVASGKTHALPALWADVHTNPGLVFEDGLGRLENGKMSISLMPLLRRFIKDYGFFKTFTQLLGKNPKLPAAFLDFAGCGLIGHEGLKKILDTHLAEELNVPLLFSLVSLENGQLYECCGDDFASREDLINGIIASTTMPGVWEPIPRINLKDGTSIFQAVDGGIRNVAPMSQLFHYIKDNPAEWTIYIIAPNSRAVRDMKSANLVDIAGSTIDVMLNEIWVNDLDTCLHYNELARWDNGRVVVDVFLFEPQPGELGGTLDSTRIPVNFNKGLNAREIKLS